MGGVLSVPIQSKTFQRSGNKTYRCASADMQGYRINMEDEHNICMELDGHPDIALFGVYDGHGGDQASAFIAANLPRILGKLPDPTDHAAITRSMIQMDLEFLKPSNAQREHGSTCVYVLSKQVSDVASLSPAARAALASDTRRGGGKKMFALTVVNAGDSRAILLGADGRHVPMTKDHKPQDEEESRRIYAAGGCVKSDRVDGSLALSRAIGDWNYKSNSSLTVAQQKVIPIPTITTHIAYEGDRILVCCDGLFEQMSNEEVADFAYAGLLKSNDPAIVMGQLIEQSLVKGSRDNMSALVAEIASGTGYAKPDEFVAGPFHENAHKKKFRDAYLADAKSRGYEGDRLMAVVPKPPPGFKAPERADDDGEGALAGDGSALLKALMRQKMGACDDGEDGDGDEDQKKLQMLMQVLGIR